MQTVKAEILAHIIAELTGGQSLAEICAGNIGVCQRTIERWIAQDWRLKEQVERAKAIGNPYQDYAHGYVDGKTEACTQMWEAAKDLVGEFEREYEMTNQITAFVGSLMLRLSKIAGRLET